MRKLILFDWYNYVVDKNRTTISRYRDKYPRHVNRSRGYKRYKVILKPFAKR